MQIVIDYDTVKKNMLVKMGNKTLKNVVGVYCYPDWDNDDNFHVEVTQRTKNEDDDMFVITRTLASQTGEQWDEIDDTSKTHKLAKALFPDRIK